jgi:hypothetical protein
VDEVIDGFLLDYSRPGGAIRGKWRILDGKGESVMVHKFEAQRMVAPACVDEGPYRLSPWNKQLSCVLEHMGTNTPRNVVARWLSSWTITYLA